MIRVSRMPVAAPLRVLLAVLVVAAGPVRGELPRAELPRLPGTVVGIVDGDTVDVRLESGMIRVRLHGVDAPERDQPYGKSARRALSRLVYLETVEIEPVEQDQSQRLVARLWLDGRNVNAELLESGNAWVYRHYAQDPASCAREQQARRDGHGLWSLPREQWIAPWEWRRRETRRQPFTDYSNETVAECAQSLDR
jgi:endonuclease YncB( thermonuclease family)